MLAAGVRVPLRLRPSYSLANLLRRQPSTPWSRQSLASRSFHRSARLREQHAPTELPSFLEAYKQAGMVLASRTYMLNFISGPH